MHLWAGAPGWLRLAVALCAAASLSLGLLGVRAADLSTKEPADAESKPEATKETSAESSDARQLFAAIVKVQTRAVPNARTASQLGQERDGSGILIGDDGLILTIGYLIVEADEVKIVDRNGRTLPAKIVAYDHASGLGLIRAAAPLDAKPVPFGDSTKLAERDPVMIVNSGGADDATLAIVVSRRQFTASWEYMLEQAIFTSPPSPNWSGAALVDANGRLLGVGSLIVRDALGGEHELPGNMFVPIDVLKPVLADMIRNGRRPGPARPWLGIATDEHGGRVIVTRVSPEGPGDRAGIKAGDIILAVGGQGVRSQAEYYTKVWQSGAAGTDIPLRMLQGIDVKELEVHSIDRIEYFRPQSTF
jgi:S1-C subfamily serine protease